MIMDRKGMVGFPVRLAVTFLILALAVPSLMAMMGGMQEEAGESAAASEADKISSAVSRAYYSGVGGTCTVGVSISSGYRLVIGGDGADAYCISVLCGDEPKEKIYLQRPPVRIMNSEPLEISGERTLLCTCAAVEGAYGVEVSVIS
ncbi:MAG: hypothetical protein LBS92_04060 [Candidatus Methanoplasma sp.]|jgi:hypothetical protein|nr:hypothetical protein [Candidatus Methanoplasma sp.]